MIYLVFMMGLQAGGVCVSHLTSLLEVDTTYFNDKTNAAYESYLLKKFKVGQGDVQLVIDHGKRPDMGDKKFQLVYPTAIAPKEMLEKINIMSLSQVYEKYHDFTGDGYTIDIRFMNAGTGTTIKRNNHLRTRSGRMELGAKGTDLYIEPEGSSVPMTLAHIKYLRLYVLKQMYPNIDITVDDIVSRETMAAIEATWKYKRPGSSKTLQEYFEDAGIKRGRKLMQYALRNLDSNGDFTEKRKAPGGHGFFGFQELYKRMFIESAPREKEVSIIANGEDFSGIPPLEVSQWMEESKIPIVMMVTDKTKNDLKGGQIFVFNKGDKVGYGLLEAVQSKNAGQSKLFEDLGINIGDTALFNTNTAIFHSKHLYDVIQRLRLHMTDDEILLAAMPDLIKSEKKNSAGETFTQLEGALGSLILNLNSLALDVLGEPIVAFLQVPADDRVSFFAPVKTAWDFYLWFYSDRFFVDISTYLLKDLNPRSPLPRTSFTSTTPADYYSDVDLMLNTFKDARVKNLRDLEVSGLFNFSKIELVNELKFENKTTEIIRLYDILNDKRLVFYDGRKELNFTFFPKREGVFNIGGAAKIEIVFYEDNKNLHMDIYFRGDRTPVINAVIQDYYNYESYPRRREIEL